MATVSTNFATQTAFLNAGTSILLADSLEYVAGNAEAAFDSANNYDFATTSTATETFVQGTLENGASATVYGSSLLNNPKTVTQLNYTSGNFTAQLYGSAYYASDFADPTGYVNKVVVIHGSSTVTLLGNDNLALDNDAIVESAKFQYGSVSVELTGTIDVDIDGAYNVTLSGNVNSATLISGASTMTVFGLNLNVNSINTDGDANALFASVLSGADTITGSGNADYLAGYGGADTLKANGGADKVQGGAGADKLYGAGGNDRLEGGDANDFLWGGTGNDTLQGGAGADRFYFDTALNSTSNKDVILDFNRSQGDKIYLDNDIFTKFLGNENTRQLTSANFRNGNGPGDGDDYFYYKASTGELFYDNNGSSSGGNTMVVAVIDQNNSLTSHPTSMMASDFFIVG